MVAARLHAASGSRHPPSRAAEGKEPLQMRIPTRMKRAFKAQAALRGIEPNALFAEMWEF
jgi:hypothetical protein